MTCSIYRTYYTIGQFCETTLIVNLRFKCCPYLLIPNSMKRVTESLENLFRTQNQTVKFKLKARTAHAHQIFKYQVGTFWYRRVSPIWVAITDLSVPEKDLMVPNKEWLFEVSVLLLCQSKLLKKDEFWT